MTAALAAVLVLASAATQATPSHPALPLPLSELPANLLSSADVAWFEAPRAGNHVCGPPDVATALADDDPTQGGRKIARALDAPSVTVAALVCRDELSRVPGPTRVHALRFETAGQQHSVLVFTWTLAELPKTSTLAMDAAQLTGIRRARCFASLGRTAASCNGLSETFAELRDGLWLAGTADAVRAAAVALSRTDAAPRLEDVGATLARSARLERARVSFVPSELWAWGERFVPPESRLASFFGYEPGAPDEPIYGIVATSEAEAATYEGKLRAALEAQKERTRPLAKAAAAPCRACASAYDRYHHVRPKRDLAALEAVEISRDGAVVRVVHRRAEVPDVAAAQRAREAERRKRDEKIAPVLERWRKGQAPGDRELRSIGGEALVRTVKERRNRGD